MLPYLIQFSISSWSLRVPTYGFLLAIAFSLAYTDSLRRARQIGENLEDVDHLFLIVVFGSMVGARLFHVFFEEWPYYAADPMRILRVWEGGYTFFGGLLIGLSAMIGYCRYRRISFLQFADLGTPGTLLGLGLGRVGCFAAGCCWGKPTSCPLGVTFTNPEAFTNLKGIPLHPTQLYEAFGALVLAAIADRVFRHRRYAGQVLRTGLIGYGVLRFTIEMLRGDEYRGFLGPFSYSQWIALALLAIGLFAPPQPRKA